jgi:chorismate mutase
MTFRRYAILDEHQANYEEVFEETAEREEELQEELALTLEELKNASTDAEVQKQAAKIDAIDGQLAALAAERRDRADQVVAQKIANDSRIEEERLAATELEMRDVYLGNQRITAFMRGIKFRQPKP